MGKGVVGILAIPILRLLAWVWYAQPTRLRLFWGDALGAALRKAEVRAEVVRANLERAYPGDAHGELRETLFRAAYRHVGLLTLEVLLLFGPLRRFALGRCEIIGLDHWRAAKELNRGVILLANHVGNWEIMAATGVLHGDIDILLVTKRLKPAWLHAAIEKARLACRVRATYEPRTFKDVLRHLSGNGTVGIVLDQYAGPPVGVRVPFFGIPVGTHSVIATLAKRTGSPVLPVVNHRRPDGSFLVEIQAQVAWESDPDASREVALNTARYAAVMESHVRAYPDQWLWTHRRFKGELGPLGEGEWSRSRARK